MRKFSEANGVADEGQHDLQMKLRYYVNKDVNGSVSYDDAKNKLKQLFKDGREFKEGVKFLHRKLDDEICK